MNPIERLTSANSFILFLFYFILWHNLFPVVVLFLHDGATWSMGSRQSQHRRQLMMTPWPTANKVNPHQLKDSPSRSPHHPRINNKSHEKERKNSIHHVWGLVLVEIMTKHNRLCEYVFSFYSGTSTQRGGVARGHPLLLPTYATWGRFSPGIKTPYTGGHLDQGAFRCNRCYLSLANIT